MIIAAAMRPVGLSTRFCACSRSSAISGLDQAHRQHDAQRHDDYVIQIAQHRNEVRDQIDRRDRIAGHQQRDQFGVPRVRLSRAASQSA